MSEPEQFLPYGQCPACGAMRQPDYMPPIRDIEYVVCCDCRLTWTLYHDDKNDKRDETETHRLYRIGDIESFADALITPSECDD